MRRIRWPRYVVLAASSCLLAACKDTASLDRPPEGPRSPAGIHFELGTPEVVFSYRQDRCEEMDLPDVTARAVRMPEAFRKDEIWRRAGRLKTSRVWCGARRLLPAGAEAEGRVGGAERKL